MAANPTKPAKRGKPKKAAADAASSADALLDAALALFSERGYAAVTIKDIATATGVNSALIYYYFGSKDALFRTAVEAAVDRAFKQFEVLRGERTAPRDTIAGWLDNHVLQQDRIRKLVKIGLDYSASSNRAPAVDEAIRRFYLEEMEIVAAAIRQGVADGSFRQVDATQVTGFMSTFLDGVMVRSAIVPDFDVPSAVENLKQILFTQLLSRDPA